MAGGTPAGFKDWLGGLTVVDQGEGDLGARMLRALAPGPAMIVGSDIPDLAPEHLVEAARLLGRHEVVLGPARSEEHTSELQSLMRISYDVFCLKQKKQK